MRSLTEAIERMREVHEDFNGTMTDLDHEIRTLRARLTAFDRKMGHLGREVGQVGILSRSLEHIMHNAISNEDAPREEAITQREHRRFGINDDNEPDRRLA